MSDAVIDYTKVWMDTFARVRSQVADNELAIAITSMIVSPFYYWFQDNDAKYMEGSDAQALAETAAGGSPLDSPPSSQDTATPSSDWVPVSVTGTAPNTIAAKEDLKKYGLLWDGQAWAGNIEKEHLLGLKKFCDKAGIVLHGD